MQEDRPTHVQLRLDNCLWCGKALPQGRYDRKTHDACRYKVHRYKRKALRYSNECIARIKSIEDRLKYDFSFNDGISALRAIQNEINEVYLRNNIVRVK